MDTPLGTVQIGGCDTPLSATLLFQMIRELQAQVAILTEYSENSDVIFNRLVFASKAEFTIWLAQENPAGDSLAVFVDIVSIWSFGSANNTSPAEWLKELHQSKSIGLKGGGVKAPYLHSMKTSIPAEFAGLTNKTQITNLTTIKMLESMDAWKGNGLGESGVKVWLNATMAIAMWRHCQYCDKAFPDRELKELALKTAEATKVFWSQLGTYTDNEHITLMLFNFLSKHILLLLFNQVVKICEDIFKPHSTASNTDIDNSKNLAAARFAWVTLQAHGVMEGYLKDKFRHHRAISGCFVHFLTHHMADQLALGLKSSVKKLETMVKELKAMMATKVSIEAFNKLDSKVTLNLCRPA